MARRRMRTERRRATLATDFQCATPYKTVTGVTTRYQQVMPKEEDTPSSGISSRISPGSRCRRRRWFSTVLLPSLSLSLSLSLPPHLSLGPLSSFILRFADCRQASSDRNHLLHGATRIISRRTSGIPNENRPTRKPQRGQLATKVSIGRWFSERTVLQCLPRFLRSSPPVRSLFSRGDTSEYVGM